MFNMASESINVCLRVLKKDNKSRYDSYAVKNVPLFDNVNALKDFFKNCHAELSPAVDTTFQIGYYGDRNKKFSMSSPVQLAEAMSLAKKGWVTLWVDTATQETEMASKQPGKKRKAKTSVDEDDDEESYEAYLSRLREKHDFPEFKLRCWAKMLVHKSHNSEDEPPDVPFFTGNSRKSKLSCTASNANDVADNKMKMRSAILQQLKDIKALKDDDVLSTDQFNTEKEKLLKN